MNQKDFTVGLDFHESPPLFEAKLNRITHNAYMAGLLFGFALGLLSGFCFVIFCEWWGR